MTTPPHPTQVRSACERCRRQKLRCTRQQGASSEPCARCNRLGFICEAGSQRKIGRPGKTPVVDVTPSVPQVHSHSTTAAAAPTITASAPAVAAAMDASAASPIEVFTSEESSPIVLSETNIGSAESGPFLDSLPHDSSWQAVFDDNFLAPTGNLSLAIPNQPHPLIGAGEGLSDMTRQLAKTSDANFDSLSKVNSMLRSATIGLESWPWRAMCERPSMDGLPDMAIYQVTMQAMQEYLSTIKSIHRLGGSKPCSDHRNRPEYPGSWRGPRTDAITYLQPSLDVATTFLIVSCIVQITHICETLLHMFESFLKLTMGDTLGNDGLTFAGVIITDFTTQVAMFSQMVRQILLQIHGVLGIPSGGKRRRSVWTGLLATQKDQELLGRELGMNSQQDWSERPRKIISGIDSLRILLEEVSLLTQF